MKKAKKRLGRKIIWVDKETHKKIKTEASKQEVSMKGYIKDLVEESYPQ